VVRSAPLCVKFAAWDDKTRAVGRDTVTERDCSKAAGRAGRSRTCSRWSSARAAWRAGSRWRPWWWEPLGPCLSRRCRSAPPVPLRRPRLQVELRLESIDCFHSVTSIYSIFKSLSHCFEKNPFKLTYNLNSQVIDFWNFHQLSLKLVVIKETKPIANEYFILRSSRLVPTRTRIFYLAKSILTYIRLILQLQISSLVLVVTSEVWKWP